MNKITERTCKKCNTLKPIEKFTRDKYESSGYTYTCTKCRSERNKKYYQENPEKLLEKNDKQKINRKEFYNSESGIISSRKSHLKRKFGISLEEYNILSEKQNHVCLICSKPEINNKNKVLSVDHCHKTGKIRGLLCGLCNRSLGGFQDSEILLKNAIKYLNEDR